VIFLTEKMTSEQAEEKLVQLKKEIGELRNIEIEKGKEVNKIMDEIYGVQEGQMTVERMIRVIRRTVKLELYEAGILKEDPRETVKTKDESSE